MDKYNACHNLNWIPCFIRFTSGFTYQQALSAKEEQDNMKMNSYGV
jgi:hypothetical protein